MKKCNKIVQFLPAIGALIASIITIIIYFTVLKQNNAIRIIQVCIAPFIPLIIPLVNKIAKINIPFILNVLIAIHAVLALDCAAALNFYSITGFDKFLHTFFGFLGAAVLFVIMLYCNADKMNKFGFYILLLFAVLGIGALWEIWEYTSDALLGTRCQGWQLGKGLHLMTVDEYFKTYNPMTDTMWDLIVTIFGTLIFYLFLFVDKLLGSKIYNSIIRQVKSSAKEKTQSENNSPAAKNSVEVKGGEKNKKDK